ncbi:MAG TPA: heavy metal-responsive transcriptional regulator [Anaerolineae bacterium]|jgi:DNA-binding transcriptional MerR regulator
MFIQELSRLTGVTAKAIRYYESIGLMPSPQRADNNYRVYAPAAVERLRFIVAARALDFSLADIAEFLEARDLNQLPCRRVLDSVEQHLRDLDRRIADLLALRESLTGIMDEAKSLPPDSRCNEQCVCYLLTVNQDGGHITIQKESKL